MAKGKKGSGKHYVSKGKHSNVKQSTLRDMRAASRAKGDRVRNQQAAHIAGKNVVVTIENPEPNAAKEGKQFIRVAANEIWPSYKYEKYVMGGIK